ncbi:MAG: ferrous iron transport protein A [Desulfovibrionales bacterium]|nr:ferrous iron transport protein A [Desulfovibrionales bacterium]
MFLSMPLRHMEENQSGTILSVSATGKLGRRIRDMGLCPAPRSASP